MPNCSAPGCKGNYTSEDRVSVFKLPEGPPELRHVWLRALHRDDISDPKMVYVCDKHFQEEDIERYSIDSKEEDLFNQATNLSLRSDNEEKEKFRVSSINELRDKLSLIALPTDWLVLFSAYNCARFFMPKIDDHNICVDVYLEINSFLSTNEYLYGHFYLSQLTLLLISGKLKLFYLRLP